MSVPATDFDTLAAAQKLRAAGIQPAHAEAQAEAIAEAVRGGRSDLVTKADLYRALWVQGGAVVAALAALAGIAVGIASLFAGGPT